MKSELQRAGFDELDRTILEMLQAHGRISVADLARQIYLSQPAVHNRIKRLEREGIIKQYTALLDRETIGYGLLGIIQVTVQPHSNQQLNAVEGAIAALPPVLECYRLTGDYDLLLKVVADDTRSLDQFVANRLTTIDGIDRIQTSIVLHEVKVTTALVLE